MINPLQLTNTGLHPDAVRREQVKPSTSAESFSALLQKAERPTLSAPTSELEAIFARSAQTYGVPVNLLKAIAKAESNFNPRAVSSCGAQGVMQLMPQTAAGLGVTDAFDPEQNIMGGAKYISQMLDRFDGDVTLALAAYNAGPGAVKKHGGVPPYSETQNYVKTVSRYMGQELSVPAAPTQAVGKTAVSGGAAMSGIGSLSDMGAMSNASSLSSMAAILGNAATGGSVSGTDLLADLQGQRSIALLSQLMTQLEERNQEESQHTIPL